MIRNGTTLREIGEQLDISKSTLRKWPDKAMKLGLMTAEEVDETVKFRDTLRKGGTRRKPYVKAETD